MAANETIVWTFDTARFRVECLFSPDDHVDTSFDETGETAENIRAGIWEAFCTEVRVIHKDTGLELGADYLGGSIYADPRDFLSEHHGCKPKGYGAYFPDMVREAIREARKARHSLCAGHLRHV